MLPSTSQGRSYLLAGPLTDFGVSTCPESSNDDFSASATLDVDLFAFEPAGALNANQTPFCSSDESDDALARAVRDFEKRIEAARQLNDETEQRGRSWAIPADAGMKTKAPCWTSKAGWTTAVAVALDTDEARVLCRGRIRKTVLTAVGLAMASFADIPTGRGVTASNGTLGRVAAAILGKDSLSGRTVCTARWILSKLGLALELERGRYLSADERIAAAEHHGGVQLRAGSTWSLILPRHRGRGIFVLPPRGPRGSSTPSVNNSPKCAQARTRRPSAARSPDKPRSRPTLPVQRLVAEMVARTPALERVKHLGSLCRVVEQSGLDTTRWTGRDLVEAINADTKRRGWTFPDRLDNPAAWLRWRLANLDLTSPSPSEVRRQLDDEAARRRQWALEAPMREKEAEATRQRQVHSSARKAAMAEIRKVLAR